MGGRSGTLCKLGATVRVPSRKWRLLPEGPRLDFADDAAQRGKAETPLAAPLFPCAQTAPGRIDTPAGVEANLGDKSEGRKK